MKYDSLRFIFKLTLFLASVNFAIAQQSHKGKEFYLGVLPCSGNAPLVFYMSAENATKGQIVMRDVLGKEETYPFDIKSNNEPAILTLDNSKVRLIGANNYNPNLYSDNVIPDKRSIHIVSEKDIEVSMLNYIEFSADRTIIYPVEAYGTEYTVIAPPSQFVQYKRKGDNRRVSAYSYSQCLVVATQNNTSVSIVSPVDLIGSDSRSVSTMLQKGESFLVQALPNPADTSADLTGTKIISSVPVSVISGTNLFRYGALKDSVYITNDVFEHILPNRLYGKQYVLTNPVDSRTDKNMGPNFCKITAMLDTASVWVKDVFVKKLKRGESISIPITDYLVVKGSSPISVLLLRRSGALLKDTNKSFGDGFMTDMTASEYWLNQYNVLLKIPDGFSSRTPFPDNFINIVIPKRYIRTLTMNGVPIDESLFATISPFPKSGFCQELLYGTIKIPQQLTSVSLTAQVPFGVSCYGYGEGDAYGYAPGRSMNPIKPSDLQVAFKDTILCPGESVKLFVTGGDSTYIWSPNEGLSCTNCASPIAIPKVSTTYYVISNNVFGCPTLRDSILVALKPALVDAGEDKKICAGDSIQLTATEGRYFLWYPKDGLSCTDCQKPFAKPKVSTRYYVTMSDMRGCFATDSVLVSIGSASADAGKDTTICLGTSVHVRASGGNTYQWSPSPDLSCTDCPDPIITPKQSTTYTVTSYLSANCFATDTIRITVEAAKAQIIADKTILCPSDSTILKAQGGIKVQWNGEGIECKDCAETKAKPSKSGYYTLTITTATGCSAKDSVYITVNKPTVKVSPDTTICKSTKAYLRAEGGLKYSWSPITGLSCTDCARPEAMPLQTTRYTVTSYDNNNCMAQAHVLITVDSCQEIINEDTVVLKLKTNCRNLVLEKEYRHKGDISLLLQDPAVLIGEASSFRVTYNRPTNYLLQKNEDLLVTVELLSRSAQKTYTKYRLGTTAQGVLDLEVEGDYNDRNAQFRVVDTQNVIPGDGYLRVRIGASGDLAEIRGLRAVFSYPSRFMMHNNSRHQIKAQQGWSFVADKEIEEKGRTFLTINGSGVAELSGESDILSFESDVFLADSSRFTVIVDSVYVTNDCYTIPQGKGIVGLGGCFANGRAINIGIPYSVQARAENNILSIDYTTGLDGITECRLFSSLGEHITDLVYRIDNKGEYAISYPLDNLSSGNYLILFRSGIYRQSLLVHLVK